MIARALGLGLVLALASCGVPVDDHASTAGADEVPYGLLESTSSTTSSTTSVPERRSTSVAVWFLFRGGVVPLMRALPSPVELDAVAAALLDGPTAGEASLGARTAVPAPEPTEAAPSWELDGRTAVIELPSGLAQLAPQEQLLALAQIVFTATELGQVDDVRFESDGEPVAVPRGDGSVTEAPLRRADYGQLRG